MLFSGRSQKGTKGHLLQKILTTDWIDCIICYAYTCLDDNLFWLKSFMKNSAEFTILHCLVSFFWLHCKNVAMEISCKTAWNIHHVLNRINIEFKWNLSACVTNCMKDTRLVLIGRRCIDFKFIFIHCSLYYLPMFLHSQNK